MLFLKERDGGKMARKVTCSGIFIFLLKNSSERISKEKIDLQFF